MHRAEEILQVVQTTLTGLVTTGTSVERDSVYPHASYPALTIEQGEDNPITDANLGFQDCELEFFVTISIKSASYSFQYNQIKAEVYAALMADRTLNLSYVHDTKWAGDSRPEPSGEAEQKTMRAQMRFVVLYRHNYLSKEA